MGLKVCMDLEGSVEQMDTLNLSSGAELTISSGAVTVTHSLHTVDTEADAVTDDLNTINGGSAGDVILLARASAARAVVLKHNVGNIKTPSGTDHELTALGYVVLKHDGSNWHLQSGNGSGYMLNKLACLTVATTNITMADEQVINGVFCAEGSRVFLAGQTDETENGPWLVVAADEYDEYIPGTWVRPSDFQDGFTVSGHVFYIDQGTEHADSVWMITNSYGEDIVGTDDLNAVNLVGGSGTADSFDIASLAEDETNTSADYLAKYDGANNKIKRNDLLNPGYKTLTDGATITINLADPERTFAVVLGGNRTLAIVNASVGDEFWIKLIQDGTGSRTVTWWDTINWSGGSAPTLTTTADKADYLLFKCTAVNTYDCLHTILNLDTAVGSGTAPSGDIIAFWKFDSLIGGEFPDSVGSNDLDPFDSVAANMLSGSGKINSCASFDRDAGDQYLKGTTTGFLDEDFSIVFWIQLDSITGVGQVIIRDGSFGVQYDVGSNAIRFLVGDMGLPSGTGAGVNVLSSQTLSAGVWYMVACVHDSVNDAIKISINAAAFETAGSYVAPSGEYANLFIGASAFESLPMKGLLDEFGIWNKALSLAEITDLYNSGSGKTYPFV